MLEINTLIEFIFSGLGWFIFSYLYISIGEHKIHKNFMHRKILPAWVYNASDYMDEVYEAHGVRHHSRWYKEFDYEPDEIGREENLPIPMKETVLMLVVTFPLWLPIFFFSIAGGCIFLVTAIIHNRLWCILHRQMHIPQHVFFKDWASYRFLARHHFMHHQDTNRNFNVVFPFADFIFGTVAKPTQAHIREMLRLGFIKPKSDSLQALIGKSQEAIEARRAQVS